MYCDQKNIPRDVVTVINEKYGGVTQYSYQYQLPLKLGSDYSSDIMYWSVIRFVNNIISDWSVIMAGGEPSIHVSNFTWNINNHCHFHVHFRNDYSLLWSSEVCCCNHVGHLWLVVLIVRFVTCGSVWQSSFTIISSISNHISYIKCGMKLLIHSQTSYTL